MAASSLSSSPLTDFASELLLNRVMNGQLQPASKKTVNSANRALASNFDATGYSYGVLAENIAAGKTIVEGSQNALTEVLSQVRRMQELCIGADDDAMAASLATDIWNNISAVLDTTVGLNNTRIFQDPGQTTSQSLPLTIGEDAADRLSVGGIDLDHTSSGGASAFNALRSQIASGMTVQAASTLCADAIDQLLGEIADQGAKHQILSNRYEMYNDLISTYHTASDNSVKTSIDSLFNAVM